MSKNNTRGNFLTSFALLVFLFALFSFTWQFFLSLLFFPFTKRRLVLLFSLSLSLPFLISELFLPPLVLPCEGQLGVAKSSIGFLPLHTPSFSQIGWETLHGIPINKNKSIRCVDGRRTFNYSLGPLGTRNLTTLPEVGSKPILATLGCSFTAAPAVDDRNTLAALLEGKSQSKFTPLNLGVGSGGIPQVFASLDFLDELQKEWHPPSGPIAVYTFIFDHIHRLEFQDWGPWSFYRLLPFEPYLEKGSEKSFALTNERFLIKAKRFFLFKVGIKTYAAFVKAYSSLFFSHKIKNLTEEDLKKEILSFGESLNFLSHEFYRRFPKGELYVYYWELYEDSGIRNQLKQMLVSNIGKGKVILDPLSSSYPRDNTGHPTPDSNYRAATVIWNEWKKDQRSNSKN